MNYFTDKALFTLDDLLFGPEFYSADQVERLARVLREVARDQRHACAEACLCAVEPGEMMPGSEAHSAAMNARIERRPAVAA